MDVHRELGPGLLESTYEACLCHELALRGLNFSRQVEFPVRYKSVQLDCGYRLDIIVENLIVVELKAVESLEPIHTAQLDLFTSFAYAFGPSSQLQCPVIPRWYQAGGSSHE